MTKKLRVGVIFGGRSGEHAISLKSAESVIRAIPRDKYEVVQIGIARDGSWRVGPSALTELQENTPAQTPATLLPQPHSNGVQLLSGSNPLTETEPLDVIFPVLHGPMGEDGTVQGLLELAELPYVGCGVLASAVSMDKALFKDVMRANGIPVVAHVLLSRQEIIQDPSAAAARVRFPFPVFCKPANMGSSVGVSRADDLPQLIAGLTEAAKWDHRILVEPGIDAREIEFAILGNGAARASVAGEIKPCHDFYDFEAKYESGDDSELLIPAPLPASLAAEMATTAERAFELVDGAGLSRVDFLLDRTTHAYYLNEINTLPGFTSISMYPKLWEASGLSYADLIDQLIQLAISRHTDKQSLTRVF